MLLTSRMVLPLLAPSLIFQTNFALHKPPRRPLAGKQLPLRI